MKQSQNASEEQWDILKNLSSSAKIQIFLQTTQDESMWQKTIGWDPEDDNEILEEVELEEEDYSYLEKQDDNVNRTVAQKGSSNKQNIGLKYDWAYGDKSNFWSWFLDWFIDKPITFNNNYNPDQTISTTEAVDIMIRKAKNKTTRNQSSTRSQSIDIMDWKNFQWNHQHGGEDGFDSFFINISFSIERNKCPQSYFKNQYRKCQSCPTGCEVCVDIDECYKCETNFTLVEGKNFGYCFPQCPTGYFIQTLYSNDDDFRSKMNIKKRRRSYNPTMMVTQCEPCPFGCGDCIYDEYNRQPFCYSCMRGFTYNFTTGKCQVTPCSAGEFRPKPLNSTVNITVDSNYSDYLCRSKNYLLILQVVGRAVSTVPMAPLVPNAEAASFFKETTDSTIINAQVRIFPHIIGCPAFCAECNFTNNTRNPTLNCSRCQDKFYLNNSQCVLNRTCSNGSWFNDSSLSCQTCPTNCLTCRQGPRNGTVNCTSCTSLSALENSTQLCRDRCNYTTQYYNFNTSACVSCNSSQYPNISNQSCVDCPKYCVNCTWNRNSSRVECLTCTNDSYYENKTRRCRTNCSENQFFNYTNNTCNNCPNNHFYNQTSDQCQPCPANCTSCIFNRTLSRVQCTSCVANQSIDQNIQRCRVACNATQFYNWTSNRCQNCSMGTYINSTTQLCNACPTGCTNCFYNQTSLRVECLNCSYTAPVLDQERKRCRINCYNGEKYDWTTRTCRICPAYQFLNNSAQQCQSCPTGCISCYGGGTQKYCSECNSTTIFDYSRWQCKLSCSNKTTFNWDTFQCLPCPSYQYYDNFYYQCRNCPANCTTCNQTGAFTFECLSCGPGSVLDFRKKLCMPECSQTNFFYNWNSYTCQSCPSQTFYNQSSQACESCPSSCTSCVRNKETGNLTCTACVQDQVVDPVTKVCRRDCGSNAFYNWTTQSCQTCPATQVYDPQTNQCKQCPTNCSTCVILNPFQTQCQSCLFDWIVDPDAVVCRPQCASNQIYDWNLKQCTNCQPAQFVNSLSKCQNCPTNCTSCSLNRTTSQANCLTCASQNVLNTTNNRCRPTCNNSAFYDWNRLQCINCTSNQYLNTSTERCINCPSQCSGCVYLSQQDSIQCTGCQSGYIFDNTRRNCRLSCNSTSYYDWSTSQCTQCPESTFLNQDNQMCTSCPEGCTKCQMTNGQISCQECSSTFTLDSSRALCRLKCNDSAYYDWNQKQCLSCKSDQYMNTTTQTCTQCPTNCTSCQVSSSGAVTCQSCTSGSIPDQRTQTCRQQCSSTQIYNYDTRSCQSCSSGTWLNTQAQSCDFCPMGCATCQGNSTNQPECLTCNSGLIIENKRCRRNCTSNQFYDWNQSDCVNCGIQGCLTCSNSTFCTSCSEQYNNVNGACQDKCTSQQIWNANTKRCDSIITDFLRVNSSSVNMLRCRPYTVNVTAVNSFTNNQITSVQWSYTRDLGTISSSQQTQLDQIVNSANANNQVSITLTSALTEMTQNQMNFTFTAASTNNQGNRVQNSTRFIMWQHALTTITNYNTSYVVEPSNGLRLTPMFMYPECQNKGPVVLPAGVDIGCKLYDKDSLLIKSLSQCSIAANDLESGNTYYIKYSYTPHPYQTPIRDSITITTPAVLTTCQIINNSPIKFNNNEAIILNVTVENPKSSFVYRWECFPQKSQATCGMQSSTQNQPNLTVQASTFTSNSNYVFILSIFDNQVNKTTCSAAVNIQVNNGNAVQRSINTQVKLLNQGLTLTSTSTESDFLNPAVTNKFTCEADQNNLNYKIQLFVTGTSNLKNFRLRDAGIQTTKNVLVIEKNTLPLDSEISIVCTASNSRFSGSVTKTFNTYTNLEANLTLEISPVSGYEKSTNFTLTLRKPQNSKIWCRFGQQIQNGDLFFLQQQKQTFSDKTQNISTELTSTFLPYNFIGYQSQDLQTVFARCQNDLGQSKKIPLNVTVLPKPANELDQGLKLLMTRSVISFIQQSNLTFDDIWASYQNYLIENNDYSDQEKLEYSNEILRQIQQISNAISPIQTSDCINIITEVWNYLKTIDNSNEFPSVLKQILRTLISLADSEYDGEYIKTMEKQDFITLLAIFDEILSNYKDIALEDESSKRNIRAAIKTGVVRVTGDFMPDLNDFHVSGNFFAVKLSQQSKAFLQKGFNLKKLSLNEQFTDEEQSGMKEGVDVTIPYNLVFSQYDYVSIVYIIFGKELSENAVQKDDLLSNQLLVKAYFSSSKIATEDYYDISEIVIDRLQDSIKFSLPFMKPLNSSKSIKEQCSFFDKNNNKWMKSPCQDAQLDSFGRVTCCSNQFSLFGITIDKEYQDLVDQQFRQLVLSVIPPCIIYFTSGIAILISIIVKKRQKRLEIEMKKQQYAGRGEKTDEINEYNMKIDKIRSLFQRNPKTISHIVRMRREKERQQQQQETTPQKDIDHTQTDLTQNEELKSSVTRLEAIENDKVPIERQKCKEEQSGLSWVHEIKGLKKYSKIYNIYFDYSHEKDLFQIVFEKILISNIFLLSFTITIIISYYVNKSSLTFSQSKSLELIIVSSYMILLILTILFRQLEVVLKKGLAIKHIWFALHLIFAFIQPIFLTQIADELSAQHYRYWIIASCVILFISCTFEDFILLGIYFKIHKYIRNRCHIK